MKKEIKQEADNIRKFATKEEISRLNFRDLIPVHSESCIYGLMTGDCNSKRATELIEKCCPKGYFYYLISSNDKRLSMNDTAFTVRNYSAIEREIYRNPEGNKKLIKYIKS